jgi:hypothetical protein
MQHYSRCAQSAGVGGMRRVQQLWLIRGLYDVNAVLGIVGMSR